MPKTRMLITIALTIMLILCAYLCNSIDVKLFEEKAKAEEMVYEEEKVEMYAPDGRTLMIAKSYIEDYQNVGWYLEPVTYLWTLDGEKYPILKKDVNYHLSTGYWFDKPPVVDEADMLLLARVIYAEATENPSLRVQDRQYVGSVVMNRLRSGYWGSKLSNVVYARGQYACVGNYKFNCYPPKECLDIAKQLLLGVSFGVPSNVIYQAQFRQGSGLWKKVGVHYYCYR